VRPRVSAWAASVAARRREAAALPEPEPAREQVEFEPYDFFDEESRAARWAVLKEAPAALRHPEPQVSKPHVAEPYAAELRPPEPQVPERPADGPKA
ncbi:hypothetical protein G3I40_37250, partial [Streptomyces sp. SID14478]|nr:hypothetical protein [Streptomyces sp. SID14478]